MEKQQRTSDELKEINKVLDTFSLDDVTAAIFLDVRNPNKNGDYSVKIRVTHKREQHYYRCMDISIDEWETLISGKKPRKVLLKTKKLIYMSFNTYVDVIKDLAPGKHFSFEELNRRLSKGTKDSVLDAFKNKIDLLEKKGRVGSVVWYRGARNSIKKFIGDVDLKFSEVTVDWLEEYQSFLRTEERDTKGKLIVKAKKDTTISILMRALRAIMNNARGKIITEEQYPFGKKKYEIPIAEGRVIALSEDQIKKIAQYPLNPEAFVYRRLWLFSYFCSGINIGDVLRLKYESIIKDDGKTFIVWERKKTEHQRNKRTIKALMRPEMQKIIDLHGNKNKRPDNFIFPYLTHGLEPEKERMIIQNTIHTINKKMKMIGRALGYGDVTTYWARHAFTNNSLNKKVSMFSLSDRLGHATVKTTQNYAGRLSNKQIIEDANVLDTVEI